MKKTRISNRLVCQAIEWWLKRKDITLAVLCRGAGYYNVALIEKLMNNRKALPTDFLQECVDIFGLKTASRVKFEDAADGLGDDECREFLTEPLRQMSRQGKFGASFD